MRKRKPPHVAVLIESSRAYGRGLLAGVAQYLRVHGPWSVFFAPRGLGDPPPAWLRNWHGEGILARIDSAPVAEAVRATRLPVVNLRLRLPARGLPYVGVDNRAVARLASADLLDRGFRQFGFYGPARGDYAHVDQRRDDFTLSVQKAGCPCHLFAPKPGQWSWEQEQQQLGAWVRHLPKPVALMASEDDRGLQLLDACRRVGVLVPDEVAVLSVGNDPVVCEMAVPALSSIDLNPRRVGYEAAALLDRWMAGHPPHEQQVLLDPGRLVTRQSTDVLAIEDRDVVAAVRFIREHACVGINVEDVLDVMPLSRRVLEQRFKKAVGRTLKEAILGVQLERAKQLLTETDLPLAAIAAKAGFSTAKYFGDVFYRELGVRAGAYRKRLQQPG